MSKRMKLDTGVLFYPRGGSADVVLYASKELMKLNFDVKLAVGSLGKKGEHSHASTFYKGINTKDFDYNDAFSEFERGGDAMGLSIPHPFHPSFEDRGICPDTIFCGVSPKAAEHLTKAWVDHFNKNKSNDVDILHLHHLSHLQEAASIAYEGIPRVTTLHGTELKLIEGMRERMALLEKINMTPQQASIKLFSELSTREKTIAAIRANFDLDEKEKEILTETSWELWKYSPYWLSKFDEYAKLAGKIITVSEHDSEKAMNLLGLETKPIVIPNGVDSKTFSPKGLTTKQKLKLLRKWLVDDPKGWKPGKKPGSIRYSNDDIDRFLDDDGKLRPIIIWCGRFLNFKRLPLLLEAYSYALKEMDVKPILLIWGGYPGEYEGSHPLETVEQLGISNSVFFVGWRGHDDLSEGFNCADVMVAPSVNEPFGMVYIEAMAAGTPPISSNSGGPAKIITSEGKNANGWTVEPDDVYDLSKTIVEAIQNKEELKRRAANGVRHAREVYDWLTVVSRYRDAYKEVIDYERKK
jgi:glycosyltransferase involved in cell wall biosynthesis